MKQSREIILHWALIMMIGCFMSCVDKTKSSQKTESFSQKDTSQSIQAPKLAKHLYDRETDRFELECLGTAFIKNTPKEVADLLISQVDSLHFNDENAPYGFGGPYLFLIYYNIDLEITKVKTRSCINVETAQEIGNVLKNLTLSPHSELSCELGVTHFNIRNLSEEGIYYDDGSEVIFEEI